MDKKISFRRKCIQLFFALLYNCNAKGFIESKIYTGNVKGVCVPGLNCYSCPGAVGSCPLGSLQNSLGSIKYKIPMFIIGILLLFGVCLGRIICGFLCPFGLIQELLYKIPTKKLKKTKVTKILSKLKYIILVIFVVGIPLYFGFLKGYAYPAFCKFICPAGTLEGGIPLVLGNESLQKIIGFLYYWKIAILVIILISCIFIFRGFCRFICPLGAIYSLFSKISLFGIRVNESKCTHCNKCISTCKMDINQVGDYECIHCGECISECKENAICFDFCERKILKNEKS